MEDARIEKNIDSAVEAILFAYGEPISISDLCFALDLDRETIESSLDRLKETYHTENRGIQLIKLENCYQLCTQEGLAPVIRKALDLEEPEKIGRSAMEVLLIIAFFQPTTQRFIDEIRGVDSSYWITWLTERELIKQAGKLDRKGRPKAYATTQGFLRMFHLESLSELPDIGAATKKESLPGQSELNLDELKAFFTI